LIVKELPNYILLLIATIALLYPNIKHIIAYKVPTVFNSEEVKVLDKLKNIASPKDYTLTWWDYGYPIWYYSDTNTLIDGGKHHSDNYIISKILTTDSQMQAANLARIAVETYAKEHLEYSPVANKLFEQNGTALDVDTVLDEMSLDDYRLPKKTRDIYLYLPNRMLNIFPTVTVFSNLNLNTGEKRANPFFFVSHSFKQVGNKLVLGHGVSFLNNTGELELGRQKVKIKHFSVVEYDGDGQLHKQDQIIDYGSSLNMIYMKNYNTILVLDDKMYNSLFIQLFVFENYDTSLFEPVILDPLVKIYKLRR
jgi:dolichyl-diphosphooligosaccharide--protein glycosyltransferase/undecaprenyl-diphosphooligosaccharide--protein glycosyltransferase